MGEIKFRYVWKHKETGRIIIEIYDIEEIETTGISDISWNSYNQKHELISRDRYTELKDKKRTKEYPDGQEIYEGDQIGIFSGIAWEVKYGKYIDHNQEHYGFYLERTGTTQPIGRGPAEETTMLEVIGNVHEKHREDAEGK